MAVAHPPVPFPAPAPEGPPRKRFTRDDCRRLAAAGVLEPGRYELIEGDLVEKVGQNEPHHYAATETYLALVGLFGAEYVRMMGSVVVSETSEPEPDVAVTVRPRREFLTRGVPVPADLRLAVEVSDTTLRFDTTTKMRLYAAAGAPEYWVLDVPGRRLLVHAAPGPEGYADVRALAETDAALPADAPQGAAPVPVASLLP